MHYPPDVDAVLAAIDPVALTVDAVHEYLVLPDEADPRRALQYLPALISYVGAQLANAESDLMLLERAEKDRIRQLAVGRANFDEEAEDRIATEFANAMARAEDQLWVFAQERHGDKAKPPAQTAIERAAKADEGYLAVRAAIRTARTASAEDAQLHDIQQSVAAMSRYMHQLEALLTALKQRGFGLAAMKDIYVNEMRTGV